MSSKRFVKVIDVGEAQVLFFVDYDHEDEATRLHQMVRLDGATADMSLLFSGDDQEEKADAALERVNEEHARLVLRHLTEAMGATPTPTEGETR